MSTSSSSSRVYQTIILRVKEGSSLENAASGSVEDDSSTGIFVGLLKTVEVQPGCIRQFWGHQVEDPNFLVWVINWETYEHSETFNKSSHHTSFLSRLGQAFDLEAQAPFILYTRFILDATAAFEAKVTEVAIFTMPTEDYTEEAKAMIDSNMDSVLEAVTTVGKASGGATGWVFQTFYTNTPEGESISLHGVFGYDSVEDHVRWRETPEHAEIVKSSATRSGPSLKSADVPGGYIFLPDSSMFHVKFHKSGAR